MLKAVTETAKTSLTIVEELKNLMHETKMKIRSNFPNIYSQDLLNNLFRHPYTRIEFIMRDLNRSRPTATNYLEKLVNGGILEKHISGRDNYYINTPLIKMFIEVSGEV